MFKKTKKLIAIILVIAFCFTGCTPKKSAEIKNTNDKYRNYYEIFVSSFYDSDNNGIGDLQGIIKNLDYLNDGNPNKGNDLGIDGIWLMPIMPSPTYHKYDVEDYYEIDSQYGTMADFDELIVKCNERGINVIIDLVLNHTSTQHEWFQSAIKSIAVEDCGQEVCKYDTLCERHNKYCGYYNFSTENKGKYYNKGMPSGYYYQGVFWDGMPDLNLDNPSLREDIKKIGKYWLDKGVSGFRLDATTEFYDKNTQKNTEFLNWFYKEMQSVNKDVYMVGEAWTDAKTISDYYAGSEIDSFFNFPYSQSDGKIANAIRNKSGDLFAKNLEELQKSLPENAIIAPFLSNHDNGRSSGFLMRDLVKEKMAASLYMFMPGNPYIYYGEEIGMNGSGIDENKRLPFLWSTTNKAGMAYAPSGATQKVTDIVGADKQMEDENSLRNFYKQIIDIKNINPQIAKGKVSYIDAKNPEICAYKCEFNGENAYIFHNLSDTDVKINLADLKIIKPKINGKLIADTGKIKLSKNILAMPSNSTVILEN